MNIASLLEQPKDTSIRPTAVRAVVTTKPESTDAPLEVALLSWSAGHPYVVPPNQWVGQLPEEGQSVLIVFDDSNDCWAITASVTVGPQGERGEKGDTGERGEKGEKGDTGAQGPKAVYWGDLRA